MAFSTRSRSLMVSYGTVVSFDEGKLSTTVAMVGPTWILNPNSIIYALLFLDVFFSE